MVGSSVQYSVVSPAAEALIASEEDLFEQHLAQGDTTAFWELWERYCTDRFARQSLYWMAGNHADAADALSSSSLKAWHYLTDPTREVRHAKSAMTRLVHNHCMEMWRERQRQARCLTGWMNHLQRNQSVATSVQESAEETLLRHEMAISIRHAMDSLPPRLQEAAVLRFVHELSYDEIAVRLHIRPDNVRKRIQHARTVLQAQLRDYCSAAMDVLAYAPGFAALQTTQPEAGRELTAVAPNPCEDMTAANAALGAYRVDLSRGVETYHYLILDHKPIRQQQKLETLRTYVQRHPHGWKKRRALADLLYTMGWWQEAVVTYQQVVQQHPDCLDAWLRLGEIWRLREQTDDALTAYARALSLAQRDATRHHIEGLMALCRRQTEDAVQAFSAATVADADNNAHWRSLGLTHLYAAQPVEALQAFDETLQHNSDDLLALTYSPVALHAMGHSAEAQRRAIQALSIDSTNVLALTYRLHHLIPSAAETETTNQLCKKWLRRAFQIAPTAPEVHESLARYHMFRGEWSQGIEVLNSYTRNHPNAPKGWCYAARWLRRSGHVRAAAAAIMQAYACDPRDAAILRAACNTLLAADQRTQLSTLLDRVIEQFSGCWWTWTTAGHILCQGYGAKEHACDMAARGAQLQPQLAQAWFQYGRVLALADRHREAIAAFRTGQGLLPAEDGDAQALPAALCLGNSYMALNEPSEAHTWWTQAIHMGHGLKPSQPALAHYSQGKAWQALGHMTQAHQAFETALRQHLFYPARQEVLDILNEWPAPGRGIRSKAQSH